MLQVKLPELGEGVTEGEIVKWLVKPGETVKADQTIVEVMTDKATVEVPSPYSGVVKQIHGQEGDTIKVESLLVTLEGLGATEATKPAASMASTITASSAKAETVVAAAIAPAAASLGLSVAASSDMLPPADIKVLATPSTRKLAREMGVDINQMTGTGLAGRVTREDVLSGLEQEGLSEDFNLSPALSAVAGFSAIAVTAAPSGGEQRVALKGIRKKIAENMQMAKKIVPHFTLMDEAIVTDLVAAKEQAKVYAQEQGIKLTYLPYVMKALIATIKEFPSFNASIDDAKSEIVYKSYYNIGFAADTPNGLVVPVIKAADQKNILQLSAEILDLAKRARDGKLKPDEMKGATVTITNIGSVGGSYATPIINHPEVAILGMYKVTDKVVVKPDGQFGVEKAMNFTITADHRLIDGAVAARFLKAFIQRVSSPQRLVLELK